MWVGVATNCYVEKEKKVYIQRGSGLHRCDKRNITSWISRIRVTCTRNSSPGNRFALIMTVLIALKPIDFPNLIREVDPQVEELIESIWQKANVSDGANVLMLGRVDCGNGWIGNRS